MLCEKSIALSTAHQPHDYLQHIYSEIPISIQGGPSILYTSIHLYNLYALYAIPVSSNEKFRINLELPFILILSYVVLFPGLASFILWIKGISMIGANRSGVFLHLMPILSAIMAMIFFSEKFMFYHILGACFIITGILLSNKKVKNA